ncbi:hypothetical protein FB45DRAFT_1096065 [Roridomyces roridus]|uniref:CxC6 like cysteine cluster associated with KDZ domain-containing protein n=1 Tax=Roridomyces roridus TaxID=1738132 RepID=A0AAD7BFZ3_9AGAR|nr:hypothetical protein FB45DRAFT_1096065 [Roridomyces roridus]
MSAWLRMIRDRWTHTISGSRRHNLHSPLLDQFSARSPQVVWLLDAALQWVQADLVVAHCASCQADYYPDCITYRGDDNTRCQKLEITPKYMRVSKHGVWVDRQVALFQENALSSFHSGWSNFADWVNGSTSAQRKLTYRQSHRLFVEHSSRRLLAFHEKEDFHTNAHPNTHMLAEAVRRHIGVNGGVLPTAMRHGCAECTHIKRYRSDLLNEGVTFGNDMDVAGASGIPEGVENLVSQNPEPLAADPVVDQLGLPQQQDAPGEGEPRGYTRLAVMDGKTIKHRKCALDVCEGPLVNYKDGRFCEGHLNLRDVCGIIPCGRPVCHAGALTCDTESHIAWHRQYENRFSRLSFPGVRRVIRRQNEQEDNNSAAAGPSLRIQLESLGDVPGDQVVHTFKAKTTYCLQTVQWACGFPIGWGKCYCSESSPQVLKILDNIWANYPSSKPSFIAYDDACSRLRHIVSRDPHSPWLSTTKFIVDAWHYIGHRATDILCRLWCNPAPANGSQPDLILVETDANGTTHQTRAFNTETAEQLNSWLSGFEAQLRQMSDVNYDFVIHVLMMMYAERVVNRVQKKKLGLTEEFWDEAIGS